MGNVAKLFGFLAVVTLLGGCPSGAEKQGGQETTIRGQAPLNAGGKVRVTDSEGKVFDGNITSDGSFEAPMGWAEGHFIVEAIGGLYTEPANGIRADNTGRSLHAVVTSLDAFHAADIAVTPWTEIAYARGGVDGYAASLKAFTKMLTCQGTTFPEVLTVPPTRSAKQLNGLSSAAALGYVYLGAFSQLAHDLSEEIHVEQGRLTSMHLAELLADDFSDGHIDGRKGDANLYLVTGHALPPDVLRQRLAQAARHFLARSASEAKNWGNLSSIGEDAMGDLLNCISDGKDLDLGPEGEPLDTQGPALEFVTTQDSAYIASEQDVVCEAKDKSGVVSVDVAFVRNDVAQPEAMGSPQLFGEHKTVQRRVVPLRFYNVATGDLEVQCHAKDRWGNSSFAKQTLRVNRGRVAPKLTVKPVDPNGRVAGEVEIECDCSADPYSSECNLLAPTDAPGLRAVDSPSARLTTYLWDTTKVLDGAKALKCGNTTRGIARSVDEPKSVYVKNHDDGSARGVVFLDTPVKGMEVEAIAYEDGKEGAILGAGEVSKDGVFEFSLSTEYRGPIMFRAVYSHSPTQSAEFHNVPLGKTMSCTNARLTLLLEDYLPGQSLKGLSINVASSMHEAFAVAKFKQGDYATFYDATEDTAVLVSNYFSGSGTRIDFRHTVVMNLREEVSYAAHEQMVMGLFHVGLSRLAVDYSLQYEHGREGITVSEIVQAMREDLSDGKLDGKAFGAPVYMSHDAPLGEDFFRIELARAIRCWLDETPHHNGAKSVSNKTGLTKDVVTSKSPILRDFATHFSVLFDKRTGEDYDGEGPTLDWRAYKADQQEAFELRGSVLGSTWVRLIVDAKSLSKVSDLKVTHNGVALTNHSRSSEVGHGEYLIDTQALDGNQRIVIEAKDVQGNQPSKKPIFFKVDRVVPVVTLAKEVWVRDASSYRLVGTVAKPHVTAQLFVGNAPAGSPVHLNDTSFSLALPEAVSCGETHHVRIEVRDGAGNGYGAEQDVRCDNEAPKISHLSSPYTQEASKRAIELEYRLQANSESIELMSREEVSTALEKRWDRLDNEEAHAPPTLNFLVGDIEGNSIGTAPDKLHVSYKYIFRGAGVTRERDWTPLKCGSDGTCKLAMSYQTMLPEDILQQPVNTARRQNFIAYSSRDDLHSILIRVADLAGNVTVAEWTVKLELFSPPVKIRCHLDDGLLKATLMGGPAATLPNVAAANFPVFKVDISSAFGDGETSLTPADGAHVFSFKDASLEWRIDRVLQQKASLGKSMVEGNWMSCKHNRDYPIALLFADGECQLLKSPSHYPQQWNWSRQPHMRDLVASQAIRPQHFSAEIRAGANSFENTFLTLGQPQKYDGAPYPIVAASPVQGHSETQYSYRTGWEYGGRVSLKMDERRFVKDLRIIRTGVYKPEYIGSKNGTPAPIETTFSEGCESPITASWRENRAPIVYEGPAPDIDDLRAYYGSLP